MSNGSATAFLAWAILASLFLAFLFYHLWNYDRLKCLRWNGGRQPGAFKRLMTYSYLMATPLLVVFGVGISTLKFKEGFVFVQHDGARPFAPCAGLRTLSAVCAVMPKPPDLWTKSHQHFLLGLFFIFSAAWALEQVTHFEELAFWLFLLDQGPEKREWFTSWEYRLWSIGCVAAILGMPLTTLIARHNLLTIDAWIFLVGGCSSTVTNVLFLYVLVRFPSFLRHVKGEGADPDVVVRLSTFYELNLVRIVFRFAAALPLLVLAVDGIHGEHVINRSLFWSDILLMISAIGQFISSLITVNIFFPRSVTKENGYRHRAASSATATQTHPHGYTSRESEPAMHSQMHAPHLASLPDSPKSMSRDRTPSPPPSFARHAYTRSSSELAIELARPPGPARRTTLPESALHPYVVNYTSPIDLIDVPPDGVP
ncbi:hypothetical protein BC834DRAFT_270942 [Gloeopeniophorella convolvens]|nr:hypothetical protein BC834DRAFT_270942 [Gloeopeniophorella convolvens]